MRSSRKALLEEAFGFENFLPGQQETIDALLAGRSVLAIFPTGAGKSLCYQLPALMFDGLTVVVSPLIALMKDQIDFLRGRNIPAARLDSTMSWEEVKAVYDGVAAATIKLLYVSPERFANERFLERLGRTPLAMMAIDEAHCISEWGHNFRPDYLRLAELARRLGVQRVLALTATATPTVARDIAQAFAIQPADLIQTGFHRPNLFLRARLVDSDQRRTLLLERLKTAPPGPAIVYVTLQRTAEQTAEFLQIHGLDAVPYHAGMKDEARTRIQDRFMASEAMIVVATIAFGMGVDKSNIRAVIHANLPKGIESYAQEIGRAGRDGAESVCELLGALTDVIALENFAHGDVPEPEGVAGLVDHLLEQPEAFDISIYQLANTFDIRPLVVKTLLAYLELEGMMEPTGPFYAGYRFEPLKPSREILARFDRQRAAFLANIFRQARRGTRWFSLDLDHVAQALGVARGRIVAALDYLEEHGDLRLETEGARLGFRRLGSVDGAGREALLATLNERMARRENQEVERIRQMVDFARAPDCLTARMLDYFGESLDPCGHCDRCRGEPLPAVADPPPHDFSPADLQRLNNLLSEGHQTLSTPRRIARFLCGLASPAISRARLVGHPLFGVWGEIPFRECLEFVGRNRS